MNQVLQYFGNLKQNLAATDAFAAVIKVINHTGMCDVELACYSQSLYLWFGAWPQNAQF